jgi:hypothetical protein
MAALGLAALYWALDLAVLRAGIPHPLDDVWEYGVAARHLLLGDGFRTSVIHPPLWGLRDAALTVPLLVHGPLLPLLFAPFLASLGSGILDQVAWLAAAFAWLTAWVLFRLGRRIAGPAVGAAAALVFTFAPLTLNGVNHDISVVVGAFFLVLAFDLLAQEPPRIVAAALALALGDLVRPEMLLALPGLSLLAGGAGTVILILGVAVVGGGWWWHNFNATGSPFFNISAYMLVGQLGPSPGLAVLRDFALTPARWPGRLLELAPWVLRKASAYLPHALKQAAVAPSLLTGWLAAVGFIVGVARAATRWIAIAAFLCALVPLAIMTFTIYDPRFITPFLPLWAISAAIAAQWLWGWVPRVGRTNGWVAVLVLLLLPATVPALVQGTHEARDLEVRLARERAQLETRATGVSALPRLTALGLQMPADSLRPAPPRLMFSDTPDFVAWTTGRPAVWMTQEEYERLPAPPVAGIPAPAGRAGARRRAGETAAPTAAKADTLPARGAPEDTWFHPDFRRGGSRFPDLGR